MLSGEDLPDDLFREHALADPREHALAAFLQPFLDASPEAGRDALFAMMIAPALVWLSYCRSLYGLRERNHFHYLTRN